MVVFYPLATKCGLVLMPVHLGSRHLFSLIDWFWQAKYFTQSACPEILGGPPGGVCGQAAVGVFEVGKSGAWVSR